MGILHDSGGSRGGFRGFHGTPPFLLDLHVVLRIIDDTLNGTLLPGWRTRKLLLWLTSHALAIILNQEWVLFIRKWAWVQIFSCAML